MDSVAEFQPLPGPVGINEAFISDKPTTLVLEEKFSLFGDDFTVKTGTGRDVFRCNGRSLSLSSRKEFCTPGGEHLFTLREVYFSFPRSWYLERPSGEKVMTLKAKFSFWNAKLEVTFKNMVAGGADVNLVIRGTFFDRAADICWNGLPVAKIRRDFFTMREALGNLQTYGVQIAPGVDVALIAACCIAFDEQRSNKNSSPPASAAQ